MIQVLNTHFEIIAQYHYLHLSLEKTVFAKMGRIIISLLLLKCLNIFPEGIFPFSCRSGCTFSKFDQGGNKSWNIFSALIKGNILGKLCEQMHLFLFQGILSYKCSLLIHKTTHLFPLKNVCAASGLFEFISTSVGFGCDWGLWSSSFPYAYGMCFFPTPLGSYITLEALLQPG